MNIMITVILQLTGAVLLVSGLAFGNKKDIIGASIGPGGYTIGEEVPKIVEEKWKEVFLCRWGLTYTITGYIIGMFEEELLPNIQLQTIAKVPTVLFLVILLSIITYKICVVSAKRAYRKTTSKEFEQNLKPGTPAFEVIRERDSDAPNS